MAHFSSAVHFYFFLFRVNKTSFSPDDCQGKLIDEERNEVLTIEWRWMSNCILLKVCDIVQDFD